MNNMLRHILFSKFKLSAAAKLVYCFLLDAGAEQYEIALSVKRIAKTIGLSKSTVRRNLHSLREKGLIDIIPQYAADGGRR